MKMTATTPLNGAVSRACSATAELTPPTRMQLTRAWRIAIAARDPEIAHTLASALAEGDSRHEIELLRFPVLPGEGSGVREPEVLLLDNDLIEQPPEYALAALRRIRPMARILVFGEAIGADHLTRLMHAGVHGFIDINTETGELRHALRTVMAGKVWIDHCVVHYAMPTGETVDQHITLRLRSNVDKLCEQLTRREQEILCQVIKGYAIKQIAAEVHLSHQGVKMHLARLFRKFGASNRNQLILTVLNRISPTEDLCASLCKALRAKLEQTSRV
jgi:DNA-binding NarL/FixJ family response regulator